MMTDADRQAFDALLLRLEQHYDHTLRMDVRAGYFRVCRDAKLSLADVEAAIEYYLHPRWPPPALLLGAHVARVEWDNHNAEFALAEELLQQEPSERRDALLNALGFGKELPPEPRDDKKDDQAETTSLPSPARLLQFVQRTRAQTRREPTIEVPVRALLEFVNQFRNTTRILASIIRDMRDRGIVINLVTDNETFDPSSTLEKTRETDEMLDGIVAGLERLLTESR